MVRVVCAVLVYFLVLFNVNASASVFVGVGAGVTDGVIVEAGYKMNSFLSFRGRVGHLPSTGVPLEGAFETDGNTPFGNLDSAKFDSTTFDIGAEFTPLPFLPIVRGIRIIGALQYMNMGVDLTSNLSGSYSFGGGLPKNATGSLIARIQNKQALAPYLGIGWDIINIPFVTIRLTGGATLRSFEMESWSKSAGFTTAASPAEFLEEVNSLKSKIEKDIIIPSVTLTARFNMIDIPFIPFI
ncbi:MAG: hypothetical protein ACI9CD_000268 [Candidatus Deianiraeaceae bacterium]|jgi:hypothetical protein